jgi:transcriptional regulator with GAF, ATPase, and Fis domain
MMARLDSSTATVANSTVLMPELPSRETLTAVRRLLDPVVSPLMIGLAWTDAEGVRVVHASSHGIGAHVVSESELPAVLRPSSAGAAGAAAALDTAIEERPIEWSWHVHGVRRVYTTAVPGQDVPTALWVGLDDTAALDAAAGRRFGEVAASVAELLRQTPPPAHEVAVLRRLDAAAALLPALIGVLDVREVFTRLSVIGGRALPHDLLTLGLFDDALTAMTVYTLPAGRTAIDKVVMEHYPVAASRSFDFDILDDRAGHPVERDRSPTDLGMRSSLRLPLRVDNAVIGGLGFNAVTPAAFTAEDVAVGRRLAEIVAVALSHQRLAHRLAAEATRNQELRARAASLEMLDNALTALTDTGSLADVFGRFSAIAQTALRHDAASLLVRLPDGRRARRYASVGFTAPLPDVIDIPEELLANPDWDHDIVDDVADRSGYPYEGLAHQGLRSMLRVSLRHDERFAGSLVFLAKGVAAFSESDVALARRIADRMVVTLVRNRELEQARRADAATERAALLEARVRALTEELDARTGYRRVVGESAPWRQALTQATQVAATDTTVLLLGESGTGKEVVARFLHRASPRASGPFVALNCAALPEHLLEAELFGYERGAFTGAVQSKPGQLEQAAGGTLLLDEVGEMSPAAQAKFLRVLQEREFKRLGGTKLLRADARIVAATNRDLRRAVAQGHFREDLYYRLDVFPIRLPALRDRRDDILPLCDAFLAEIGRGLGRPPAGISRDARQVLVDYAWPGNVRELRNLIERAAILCDGGLIATEHLAIVATPAAPPPPTAAVAPAPPPGPAGLAGPDAQGASEDLSAMERSMIEQALQKARFNKSKAAAALGLTRHQLYLRMKKYGLD